MSEDVFDPAGHQKYMARQLEAAKKQAEQEARKAEQAAAVARALKLKGNKP